MMVPVMPSMRVFRAMLRRPFHTVEILCRVDHRQM
jgi:hypothetical protein